jgi:simple sugar transport system ATP-binding protein
MPEARQAPFVEITGVSKSYAGVTALSDVGFTLSPGEVVCLAGENGSGKSTLIKVLSGVVRPDRGGVTIDGATDRVQSPRDAIAAGIQVIFQDFSLFPNLSVAENVAFSAELSEGRRLVRRSQMRKIAAAAFARVGVAIDLERRVDTLSVADKQLVAICRALASKARLIVMDEPTTALTEREVRSLLAIIRRLSADGVAVLFVSHKLAEIFEVCEKIVVLRNGAKVAEGPAGDFDLAGLAFHMTGRTFAETAPEPLPPGRPVLLEVERLNRAGVLQDVSLSLRSGEVLGITGLLGSGRTALAKALFGLLPLDSGRIVVEGREVTLGSPRDAIAAGIGYVPEDRLTEGLFLSQSIARNIAVGRLDAHRGGAGFIDRSSLDREVADWIKQLRIVAPDADAPVQSLSGGNQQRVVLARWLATAPKVLVLNGPTVGVDIGSKADIHAVVARLSAEGMGVIVISDDLPEVLGTCHRILVMKAGRIVDEVAGGSLSEGDLARKLAA